MELVWRWGNNLVRGSSRFKAFGFNYTFGAANATLDYFSAPTPQQYGKMALEFGEAKRLGANTLRIYLELPVFMRSKNEPKGDAFTALRQVLSLAEQHGLYLDITGNLVWRLENRAAWYDALSRADRWATQENFWRWTAWTCKSSDAVLCYEICSEPGIGGSDWYHGEFGGYWFLQSIRLDPVDNKETVARNWATRMRDAIRVHDTRHLVGLGTLGYLNGPFGTRNMNGILDLVLVHIYAKPAELAAQLSRITTMGTEGCVILGETFPLHDVNAQRKFLEGLPNTLDGCLGFFDGRTALQVTQGDLYGVGLEQLLTYAPK